jgi:hypothetical protein
VSNVRQRGHPTEKDLTAPWPTRAPATLFDRDEFPAAHAFAVQPAMFQWDAYLLPAAGEFFFFFHHHELCYALARDETALAYLKTRLRAWDFKESLEGY